MASGRSVVPEELKSIQTYLIRANEIQGKSPLISYFCRAHAVECGIALMQKGQLKDEASKKYLIDLMNQLEKVLLKHCYKFEWFRTKSFFLL